MSLTEKTIRRARPHAVRGDRLRKRKEELIARGELKNEEGKQISELKEIAKAAGVSISGFQQWERGETWPRDTKRTKLAKLMGWSVQELDHGLDDEQRADPMEEEGDGEMSMHPVTPDEVELLALYRALDDQKPHARQRLKAMLQARHVSQKHVRGKLRAADDTEVENKMPVTKTPTEGGRKLPGAKRRQTDE